jgi:hypothetical protein
VAKVTWATLIILAGLVVACGGSSPSISQGSSQTSSPTPTSPKSSGAHKLEVLKVGFGSDRFSTVGVVVFKNDSTVDGAGHITIQFGAYSASGQVLGSSSTTVAVVRAGQTMAAADDITGIPKGSTVDHVVAQISAGGWEKDPHPEAVIQGRNAQWSQDSIGVSHINGELVSHYQSDLKQIIAVAVCYDSAQKIDGGGFTFVDLLPGGGTTAASVQGSVSGSPTSCELYATLSNLSTT